MFRKIHSNRAPDITLTGELRKEFSKYFKVCRVHMKDILELRPKITFAAMVILLAASLVISLISFNYRSNSKIKVMAAKPPLLHNEVPAMMQLAAKLKQTVSLRNLVDSLAAKKHLDGRDSILLDSALDRLGEIQQTIH